MANVFLSSLRSATTTVRADPKATVGAQQLRKTFCDFFRHLDVLNIGCLD